VRLGEVAARHPLDFDAALDGVAALAPDRLALARREGARKSSKPP
jgi:hypothetical protein